MSDFDIPDSLTSDLFDFCTRAGGQFADMLYETLTDEAGFELLRSGRLAIALGYVAGVPKLYRLPLGVEFYDGAGVDDEPPG